MIPLLPYCPWWRREMFNPPGLTPAFRSPLELRPRIAPVRAPWPVQLRAFARAS